ncbi:MAG: hypothetical protein J7M08_05270 [Planctomycetes bacterium]|nr:hypothetical protein [Planctomycetota bacterium]
MATFGALWGNPGNGRLVRLLGYREVLSLDQRGRFRLPDQLAAVLREEVARLRQSPSALNQTPAFSRLSFYFVPATEKRILLYPLPNIGLAIQSFEDPPPGFDHDLIRRAREYFYAHMRFVEADKQNRLAVPEDLKEHADIDETVKQVTLVAHHHWLVLTPSELAKEHLERNKPAFDEIADELLNPAYPPPEKSPPDANETG